MLVVAVVMAMMLVQTTLAVEIMGWEEGREIRDGGPDIIVQELSSEDLVNWKRDNEVDWSSDDVISENSVVKKGSFPVPLASGVEVPISAEYEDDNKPIPIKSVDAVQHGNAELPCDIKPTDRNDEVYLVLWYKDLAGKPLYSYDVRSRSISEALHWSDEHYFGKRARFRDQSDPTVLLISNIKLEEEGVYRCRVDYRNSPTRNIKVNLTVVVPPSSPRIWSPDKKIETSRAIAGVYDEGDQMDLRCNTVGGRPPPSVTWWIDGVLVDSKYSYEGADTVVNKLTHLKAERKYDGATLECRASNNNVSHAQSRMVEIKINLRPEKVEIVQKPTSVIVGREYKLVCQAVGSKPPPTFTWTKNRKQVDQSKVVTHVQEGSQVASSIFTIVPEQQDDQREITCRAENPKIKGRSVEDTMVLSVMYPPTVNLRLGPSISPSDIKENDDVYFECNAHSNPPISKLEWMHNDKQLFHKVDSGIILSNFSLVLQNVRKEHSGSYTCIATNSHGNGSSNQVILDVQYRPTCDVQANRKVYGIAPGGSASVFCHLESNPPVETFRWWISNSGKSTEIPQSKIIQMGSDSVSVVNFTAETDTDYGTLSCLGYNRIGGQIRPCSFTINPASIPYSPENCTIKEDPKIEMQLICVPSYDGGLRQIFILEIYDSVTMKLMHNFTSHGKPEFNLTNLRGIHPLQFDIFASNARGVSEKVIISNVKVNPPAKQISSTENTPGTGDQLSSYPHLPFWISAFATVVVLLLIISIVMLKKRQALALELINCKGKCQMSSSSSTENPMNESIENRESISKPDAGSGRHKTKETDPPWPDTEWSHAPTTTATRCVTFSDNNQYNRNLEVAAVKSDVSVRMCSTAALQHCSTATLPTHAISPPPYHNYDRNGVRHQGNFYQNPMDQEYGKPPVGGHHGSYTLDRGYTPDIHYTLRTGSAAQSSHVTFNTQPRRSGAINLARIQPP